MKTKFKILYTLLIATTALEGMAGGAYQDQVSNLAKELRKHPADTEVHFAQSDGASSVKHAPKPIAGGEASFMLKEIDLKGNTVYHKKELESLYKSYVGKKVSLVDVQKMAHAITQHYRENGYIIAQAILPAQNIDPTEGKVRIEILEGILTAVSVEGGSEADRELIGSQLKVLPLGVPFNMNAAESKILNIRKTPGMLVQPTFVPIADKPGYVKIIFKIGKRTYVDGRLSYDNTGNKYSGLHKTGMDITAYNVAGKGKTLFSYLRSTNKKLFNFYRVRQTQFVGDKGDEVYGEFAYSSGRPNLPFVFKPTYQYANLMFMHPIIYKRNKNVKVRFAFDGQNDVSVLAGTVNKNDHIRTARLGLLYNESRVSDFWEVSGTLNKGFLNLLGARKTSHPSRVGGKNNVLYGEGHGLWVHKFNGLFSLANTAGAQYSLDPLLATEEFAVGGVNYVRGYGSTESTADSGWGAQTELRLTTMPPISGVDYVQCYTSLGGAKLRNHKEKTVNLFRHESLLSGAVGVRGGLFKHFDFTLQAGKPLSRRKGITYNKKWAYIGMFGLRMDLSKTWDKSVQGLDIPAELNND